MSSSTTSFTFGMDRRWRRRAVRDLGLPAGARVLDVATGTGDFVRECAEQGLVPLGTDLSYGMLAAARVEGRPLVHADATTLPFAMASFDGLTCGYALRNFTELEAVIAEMGRVLRPGGRLCLLEVAEPRGVVCGESVSISGFAASFRSLARSSPTPTPTVISRSRRPTCHRPKSCARCFAGAVSAP
jgi:ubiquinone/menaquinone biosynthesis C-methylase UbiE